MPMWLRFPPQSGGFGDVRVDILYIDVSVQGRVTGTREGQNRDEKENENTHTDTYKDMRAC